MQHIVVSLFTIISMYFVQSVHAQYFSTNPTPAVDFAHYGFPTVLLTQTIDPSIEATMEYGDVSIDFPPHTFSQRVKAELLGGTLHDFVQPNTISLSILDAFAFRFTDPDTGSIITSVQNPIIIHITNSAIYEMSNIYGSTPTNPIRLILLEKPPIVHNHTMTLSYTRLDLGLVAVTPSSTAAPDATADIPKGFVLLILIFLILFAAAIIIRGVLWD